MPPKLKTEAQRQELRALIIDAARLLFAERGVEAVTMREIASRIGYSATSIYSHFADKEALLRAVCDTDFLKLADTLKIILQISDPVARMLALGRGYAQFALSFPNHYRLMFMTPHAPCTPEASSVQQNNPEQDAYFQLKSVVTAIFEAGKFKPEITDIELITQTTWAGIHGVCALEITMGKDTWVDWRSVDSRVAMMLNMMLSGLLKENAK